MSTQPKNKKPFQDGYLALFLPRIAFITSSFIIGIRHVSLLICLVLLFTSCFSGRVTYDGDKDQDIISVSSISQSLEKLGSGDRLNVLLIHGMGNHNPNTFDHFICKLAKELNLIELSTDNLYTQYSNDGLLNHKADHPKLKIYDYVDGMKRTVRFTSINWTPITLLYKHKLKLYDDHAERALLNRNIKHTVVNEGFGDVGAMADEERQIAFFRLLYTAILTTFLNNSDLEIGNLKNQYGTKKYDSDNLDSSCLASNELVLISGSLGSKLVLEFLETFFMQSPTELEKFVSGMDLSIYDSEENLHLDLNEFNLGCADNIISYLQSFDYKWYLLSNQLSLLKGMNFHFGLQLPDNPSTLSPLVEICSFYDVNDFLGFKTYDSLFQSLKPRHNENLKISYLLRPFNFIKFPRKAHEGAKSNNKVIKIIANGTI